MIYEIIFIIIPIVFFVILLFYWRIKYFFRDPERMVPVGENIVSPADGTVVYIKKIEKNCVPISIKLNRKILLTEILKTDPLFEPFYIVGIFMHPTDVHVNRAPIDGKVKKIVYTRGRNLPMTIMWWRVLLRLKPYESFSTHIITNERNTILIEGEKMKVYIVQIADLYVKKIECWVNEGSDVAKGERIGRIITGSQVDLILPQNAEILIKEGDKVKAGESVIAEYKPNIC